MGNLGSLTDTLTALTRPGGLHALGPVENVWLLALGLALIAPLAAVVAPRLTRAVGAVLVPVSMGLAMIATYRAETMLALGLITVAITAGFLASWSTRTIREDVGSSGPRRMPRYRINGVTLTRAQSRSFDYLVMRNR